MKVSVSRNKTRHCVSYVNDKSHHLPFSSSQSRASFPLVLLHSHVWRSPIHLNSGFKCFVLFVDDFSHNTWVYSMKQISEVTHHFHTLRLTIERLCNVRVCYLQSNGGGEYINTRFQPYLSSVGITHHKACPYTPSQYGLVERKIRNFIETMSTLLFHDHMPPQFWLDALFIALYTTNRVPASALLFSTPFSMLFRHTSRLHLHACIPLCLSPSLCVESVQQTGIQGLTMCVYSSRHVIFYEDTFPFSRQTAAPLHDLSPSSSSDLTHLIPLYQLQYRHQLLLPLDLHLPCG